MKKTSLILILATLLSQSAAAQWSPGTTSESADIYRSGKVGIGTTAPSTLLDLGGLKFDKISSFSAEGSISEWQWGNYIIGDVGNTSQRALRLGVSNDGFTRAEIFVDNGNRSDGTISFKTTNTEGGALTRMFIHGNGNVGIGTNNPSHTLTLFGEATANLGVITNQSSGQSGLYFRINPLGKDGAITYRNDGRLSFNLDAPNGANVDTNEYMTILSNGNVGVGVTTPDTRLTVKGVIHTNEVRVDITAPIAPDYVFEKDYNLLPLSEVEAYVNQNKHLPEVPSAKEMEENGLNLKEMNLLLLKKVEELTLHLIAQDKKVEILQQSNDDLKKQNNEILLKLKKIESQ